jgi:hypothetical protein
MPTILELFKNSTLDKLEVVSKTLLTNYDIIKRTKNEI